MYDDTLFFVCTAYSYIFGIDDANSYYMWKYVAE